MPPSTSTSTSASTAPPPRPSRAGLAARSLATPAAKAYLVGYVLDLIPSLLKAILRFVTREVKRITAIQKRAREERKAAREEGGGVSDASSVGAGKVKAWEDLIAPILAALPVLGTDMARATLSSLSPQGMASACAAAMLGWGLLDEALSKALLFLAGQTSKTTSRRTRDQLVRIWSCFIAATLASGTSLALLQIATLSASSTGKDSRRGGGRRGSHPTVREPGLSPSESFSNLKRTVVSRFSSSSSNTPPRLSLPTPLAPGGHFLARLTSLSIPGTPRADGARSPTSAKAPRSPTKATAPPLPPVTTPSSGSKAPQPDLAAQLPTSRDEIRKTASQAAREASASSSSRALGKPSPTVDLTLFALVRGLDTLVRAAPLFIGAAATRGKVLQRAAAVPLSSSSPSAAAPAAVSPSSSSAGPSIIGRQRSRQALGSSIGSGMRLAAAARAAEASSSSFAAALLRGMANQAEGITFVLCCAVIMWSWFYAPERLPPTYVRWITNLATMDERLLLALRSIRTGKPYAWQYGKPCTDPSAIDLLGSLSESLGHPYEWGDPSRLPASAAQARQMLNEAKRSNEVARREGREPMMQGDALRGGTANDGGGEPGFVFASASGPRGRGEMGGIPCELVHCGVGGASCLRNAGLRWVRGWKVCMGIYVPVHLLPRLLFNPGQFTKRPGEAMGKVLVGSARSASFLATYIASIWFMVCLSRTLLLPRLLPTIPHSYWDNGLGPLLGSFTCGLAIFIEERRKRAEMALYVAPRALYALAESARPGWLSKGQRGAVWAERVVFGLAAGVVVTAARFRPDFLRGVTSVMAWVVKSRAREVRRAAAAQ